MTYFSDDLSTFERGGSLYSSVTPVDRQHQHSPADRIAKCDLINFIAIAQSADVVFVDVATHQGLGSAGDGATGSVQQAVVNANTALAFKQFSNKGNEGDMYKAVVAEILILRHAPIIDAENIIDLLGVGWAVQKAPHSGENRLVPVLVYEHANQYGSLYSFMYNVRPSIYDLTGKGPIAEEPSYYPQLLKLCRDIGKAIEVMHACNVIHGDLKPENVLVFPGQDGGYVPKVIDFGYSTYGFSDEDLVRLPYTQGWAAPEWHHRAFQIKDAKKADIYSYTKVCNFILNWLPEGKLSHFPIEAETRFHMRQFYSLGLCEDPHKRTNNVSLLISILSKAIKAQQGSFFYDILQKDPLSVERHMKQAYGQEHATKHIESIMAGVKNHRADIKSLSQEDELRDPPKDAFHLLREDLPLIPSISKDFLEFQRLHYLVRVQIQGRLLELSSTEGRSRDFQDRIAYELALCYELAFGVERNVHESRRWLDLSGREECDLLAVLQDMCLRNSLKPDNRKIHDLISDSTSIDFTWRYKADGLLDNGLEIAHIESEGIMASLGPRAYATLSSQYNLAMLLEQKGRSDEAMSLLRQILDIIEVSHVFTPSRTSMVRLSMSRVFAAQGDYTQAILIGEQLLQMGSEDLDDGTLETVSRYYGRVCEYARSIQCIRQVWEGRKERLGETHPSTINALELLSFAMTDVDKEEAEVMESKVLECRKKIMGERHFVVIQTQQNLAFVRFFVKGKELDAIKMQQDVLFRQAQSTGSTWAEKLFSTNRLAMFQEWADQLDEAIKTRDEVLARKDDVLLLPQGLALLGNHANNLKKVGRNTEAELLKSDVLSNISKVLQPQPFIYNDIIRGVAHAYLNDGKFNDETVAIYMKTSEHRQRQCQEFGDSHAATTLVDRFLEILADAGHLVQATIYILGPEHATTKLAILRLENRLASFVKGNVEIDGFVTQAIDWIQSQIVSYRCH